MGIVKYLFSIGLYCQLLLTSTALLSTEQEVIHPPKEIEGDTRDDDIVELLEMILEKTVKTDGPFKMHPAVQMNEARYTESIKQGKHLNLIWTSVTTDLEQQLLPIRIPIRKGILGFRVFLIRKQDQAKFRTIRSVDDLKELSVGQGHFWNDVKVFHANGFKVVTGSSYEGLFEMLIQGKFDYFSRGINEAPMEYEARKHRLPDLSIEQEILLYYPWPKFFYVSPNHPELKDRLERGFKLLIADGAHQKWFWKHNQEAIKRSNLKNRRLFTLKNPLLPLSIPFNQKQLWYDPFQKLTPKT